MSRNRILDNPIQGRPLTNQRQLLLELLRDAEQTRPTPILSDPGVEEDSPAGAGDQQKSLLPDGYGLVERPGRLVRSGERVKFHFTSGSPAGSSS